MTAFLVWTLAAFVGLLCRQDSVRASTSHTLACALDAVRRRRRGKHARAIPRPRLAWPKGNHVAFTDPTPRPKEIAA